MSNHTHTSSTASCPFARKNKQTLHDWYPARATDSRSPCPAVNALANHGYISRDGHTISTWELLSALQKVYGLSWPLAIFLVVPGLFIVDHWNLFRPIDLHELRRHNRIEHNASLVHDDTDIAHGQVDAPTTVNQQLVDSLFHDIISPTSYSDSDLSQDSEAPPLETMDVYDVAHARVRRQAECGEIDAVHQEIARGEMSIILGVWSVEKLGMVKKSYGGKGGAPVSWLREWLSTERLPDEWFHVIEYGTARTTGIIETVRRSRSIRLTMQKICKK